MLSSVVPRVLPRQRQSKECSCKVLAQISTAPYLLHFLLRQRQTRHRMSLTASLTSARRVLMDLRQTRRCWFSLMTSTCHSRRLTVRSRQSKSYGRCSSRRPLGLVGTTAKAGNSDRSLRPTCWLQCVLPVVERTMSPTATRACSTSSLCVHSMMRA